MISNTKFWLLVAVSKSVAAASPASLGAPLEARVPGPAASPPSHPVRHGLPGVHQDVDQLGDHSGVSSQVHEAGGSASVANTASSANPGTREMSIETQDSQLAVSYLWTYSSTSLGISKLMTCLMSLMSRPRAATDVATRMGCFPGQERIRVRR